MDEHFIIARPSQQVGAVSGGSSEDWAAGSAQYASHAGCRLVLVEVAIISNISSTLGGRRGRGMYWVETLETCPLEALRISCRLTGRGMIDVAMRDVRTRCVRPMAWALMGRQMTASRSPVSCG